MGRSAANPRFASIARTPIPTPREAANTLMTGQGVPVKRVQKMLRLDPLNGQVFWRIDHDYSGNNRWPRWAGEEAGVPDGFGPGKQYWRVELDGFRILRARLVFVLSRGFWPPWRIAHLNGNGLDDRPENLIVLRSGTHWRMNGKRIPRI